MKRSIFKEGRKYTFSDYFEMNYPAEEIVGEFGYSLELGLLDLPRELNYDAQRIEALDAVFFLALPNITLNSEASKREFLVAPILLEIARLTKAKINVEYPLEVDDKLSGNLDYLVKAKHRLIVIEAKRKDLENGFTQLAVELIALDKNEDDNLTDTFYGAITVGDVWKFSILDRRKKHIIKNILSHTVPGDTAEVFSILLGIINAP